MGDMSQVTRRSRSWAGRVAWVLLAGLVVLAVVGPVGSGDRSSGTGPEGGQDSLPVTDTAAPASDAVQGLSEDDGWVTDTTAPASDAVQGSGEDDGWVTDTTVARQWPPETEPAAASGAQADFFQPATAVTPPAVTSTTLDWSIPPRTRHPTWDSRLPSDWDGLPGTDCHDTFRISVLDVPYAWHYFYDETGGIDYGKDESEVIGLAFNDPSFEPAAGTELHTALGNLGLSTAQDIRNLGEDAINVRWYAWWVKDRITLRGDVDHPSCASMLAGADAVLNAPLVTTTTAAS